MGILEDCENDLKSVANGLFAMENAISENFIGISQERFANCINQVAEAYKRYSANLDSVTDRSEWPVANPTNLKFYKFS